jgi:hypothetical protein
MTYRKHYTCAFTRSVLLVVSILTLLGSVVTTIASTNHSLIMESQLTISSPQVTLQNGTAGATTISTNNTNAKVTINTDNWWDCNFAFRMKITFNNSAVNENLINFPTPIVFGNSQANFWSHVQTSGNDIRFVDADNTTELYYELEQFDHITDNMVAWTKVPQVDSGSTTDSIWIYYGNDTCGFDSYKNASSVWENNYEMVLHLQETSGYYNDATSNSKNASVTGSPTRGAAGKIYEAIKFTNTGVQYIKTSTRLNTTSKFTIELWANLTITGNYQTLFYQGKSGGWEELFTISNGAALQSWFKGGDSGKTYGYNWKYGAFHHVTIVYNGSAVAIYEDGSLAVLPVTTVCNSADPQYWQVGDRDDANQPLNGVVDEYRFSKTNRSSEWIKACYQYEVDQSKFTYGNEMELILPHSGAETLRPDGNGSLTQLTPYVGNWWNNSFLYRIKITFNNNEIGENLTDFPMPIIFTNSQSSFWNHVQTGGNDTRFIDADNTTELYYELEKFDHTTDNMVAWVKVPQVDANSTNDFVWIYYGNSTVDFDGYKSPANVWDASYTAVYHSNGATNSTLVDSKNAYNGTQHNSPTATAGKIDGAMNYVASSQQYYSTTILSGKTFTWEVWVNVSAFTTYHSMITVDNNYMLFDLYSNALSMWSTDGMSGGNGGIGGLSTNTAYHLVFVREGDNIAGGYKFYKDGSSSGTTYNTGVWTPAAGHFDYIADRQDILSQAFNGILDEVRISATNRSSNWIKACYQYEADQSKFTYGTEQTYSNWLCVNELTSDGDATYVKSASDSYITDLYSAQNHSSGSGAIKNVTVWISCRASLVSGSDIPKARTFIRTHFIDYFGMNNDLTTSYADFSTLYTTNPYTNNTWTWDEIDAMEFGVSGIGASTGAYDARCTQVWVVVNWESSSCVLKVVNQVTDALNVTLKVYDSSNIGRLSGNTISFQDGTSSDQIIISNGNITQSQGSLYGLGGNTIIYICMNSLPSNTTGTSYLYTFLEIRIPGTTMYLQYIIEFEIT